MHHDINLQPQLSLDLCISALDFYVFYSFIHAISSYTTHKWTRQFADKDTVEVMCPSRYTAPFWMTDSDFMN